MDQPKYKRVLIKISGEALAGDKHFGLDFQVMGRVAEVIRECVDMGVQVRLRGWCRYPESRFRSF